MKKFKPTLVSFLKIILPVMIIGLSGFFIKPDTTITPDGALFVKIIANPDSGMAVLPVWFEGFVIGGSTIYYYTWDFDAVDGLQVDKTGEKASFVYEKEGTYIVTLNVTDSEGNTGMDTISIAIFPRNYTAHSPISITNQNFKTPYIIQGYDITNPHGNGIEIINCSNIIIQDNYIHNVDNPDSINQSNREGLAIIIQNSNNIRVERNLVKDNYSGILFESWENEPVMKNITAADNVVLNSKRDCGIHMIKVSDANIFNNYLDHNGDPKDFEYHRITGIIAWNSSNVYIHDNIALNSSSDGFGAAASNSMIEKIPNYVCENIHFYNNTSKYNGEQGIWLYSIRNCMIYNNYIENLSGIIGGSSGINFEWNISETKVFNNYISKNIVAGISISNSHDNEIYNNYIQEPACGKGAIWICDVKVQYPGQYALPTYNINIHNNLILRSLYGILVENSSENYEPVKNIEIINNTFHSNGISFPGGAIFIENKAQQVIIKNNIISKNNHGINSQSGSVSISYNNVWNNKVDYSGCSKGPGDISSNPYFINENSNFHLSNSSLCIDAGDPSSPYCLEPEPNGKRINQGRYGNTPEATITNNLNRIIKEKTFNNLENVSIYPNPFKIRTDSYITMDNIPRNTKIIIYNILGQVVFEATSNENPFILNNKLFRGNQKVSGVYFYSLKTEINKSRSGKFLILR